MLSGGVAVDRYEVEGQIGEGGMAVVYRVRHRTLGSHHALKVLTAGGAALRERLIREGRVQATLSHPNIVPVTDVIDVEGAPGLVMTFIAGPSLEKWLADGGAPLEEAERIFAGIVDAIEHAHGAGVVHRDLKPANVLLSRVGGQWRPQVADFGLAVAMSDDPSLRKTRSGAAMGTPSYMAPEQIRDARSADHRADIFALGCILYELATGRLAFPGVDMLDVFNAIANGRYEPPRALVPELPERVDAAIRGCLVADREERIPDAATLRLVLRGERTWDSAQPAGRPEAANAGMRVSSPTITLEEDEPPPAASRRASRVPWAVGAAVILAAAGWALWPDAEPTVIEAAPPAAVEVKPPPVEVKPPPVEVAPPPVEVTPPPPPVEAKPPRGASPSPKARAAPAAPKLARVSAAGADSVRFVGSEGSFPPGDIPPGEYAIQATFGSRTVSAGRIQVSAGDVVSLKCSEDFLSCDR